jgi:hypothetical protein
MKIAFIGWGSLYWKPSSLKVVGGWKEDGPYLPIEFARQSKATHLTLVLFPKASDVQTLWTLTKIESLGEAISALAKRERAERENIGYYSRLDGSSQCNVIPEILPRIRKWTDEKKLDVAVWTDLPSKFEVDLTPETDYEEDSEKEAGNGSEAEIVHDIRTEVNDENVLAYLSQLPPEDLEKEKQYVTRVHDQIDTKIRRVLRSKYGWRSLTEYKHGFWIDKNTFVMADQVEIKKVRKSSLNIYQDSVEEDMLIMTNAVEMMMDNTGKILGETKHKHFGLWLDAANKAIAEYERKKERVG